MSMGSTTSGDNARQAREEERLSKYLVHTTTLFAILTISGLVLSSMRYGYASATVVTLLWSLSCLASGAGIGFLFGIPKILQETSKKNEQPNKNSEASSEVPQTAGYSMRVNTNLEEISDWLTKIIVGLGLVNLGKIPGALRDTARIFSAETNSPSAIGFPLAIIVYFAVVGFLFGYIITRLFIQRAFALGDRAASDMATMLSDEVDKSAERVLTANPNAGRQVTYDQVEAAERVALATPMNDLTVIRQQVSSLANEYESTRNALPSGSFRTRRMELCVTKLRTLAFVAHPLLPELTNSISPGMRLAAIAVLQVHTDPTYLTWLATRMGEESAFVAYQAAVALLTAVRNPDISSCPELSEILKTAKDALGSENKKSDRFTVLDQAQHELRARCETPDETP